MRTVRVKCCGVSPILMDKMTDDVLDGLGTGVPKAVQKDRLAEDVAREKIYRENGNEGKIGLPTEMLFAALVEAGRNVKYGKRQISTQKSTTLPDLISSIQEYFLPFTNIKEGKEDEAWKVDKRRGNNREGDALCLIRPRFNEWEFEVTVEYNEKKVDQAVIRALFDNAGSAQGLGGFRPNRKGPFGRFKVIEWAEVKTEAAERTA